MGKKLLLADDSVTIQKVVGISFANEDIELITVDNGDDAVARAREARPDVVLADVVMPGMNGYEVCEALKNDPELGHVPVLLLTGTFEAFDTERAERCGAAGHIAKPFEAQTLVSRVRELMSAPPKAANVAAQGESVEIGRLGVEPVAAAVAPQPAADAAADSFDFFEDALADAPAVRVAATEIELDTDDGAFAFGDDMAAEAVPAPPATPVPDFAASDPMAGTQLMSDDLPEVAPAPDAVVAIGLDTQSAPSDASLHRLVDNDPETSDLFDFASGEADPLAGEALAQETVLDPQGASGYDVSGTDLANESTGPAGSDDVLWGDSSGGLPPVGSAAAVAADPRPLSELPEVVVEAATGETLDEPAIAALMDESSLEEVAFAEPAPDFAIGEEEPAATVMEEDAFPDFSDLAGAPDAAEAAEADAEDFSEAEAPRRVSTSHDPAALAGIALAEIEPQLREQLHDTLEKIAWENLGAVTEQIINQAVDRIEKAAWEVIPEMAETLIRDEIRRMKGE